MRRSIYGLRGTMPASRTTAAAQYEVPVSSLPAVAGTEPGLFLGVLGVLGGLLGTFGG